MDRVRVALCGVGGYGASHVRAAETLESEGLIEVAAFAEADSSVPAAKALSQRGVAGYSGFYEMIDAEEDLALACIATPIPTHFPMAKAAIEHGLHVFLEKPPVVRIQDFEELLAAEDAAGVYCAVGFQDVARSDVIALKRRLCEGCIGRVKAVRAYAVRSRDSAYYSRSAWAGKTTLDGVYVLDGPMNNSCAHVLNLGSYFAGSEPHEFALPKKVQAELYRAAPIESEDTNCIRALTAEGVELCIHLTQAGVDNHLPRHWEIIGEEGTASYGDAAGARINGAALGEHPAEGDLVARLLRRLVEVAQGSDEPLLMPLAEARGFVQLSNGAYESSGCIRPIPAEFTACVETPTGVAWVVDELGETIPDAALERRMLSECGFPWAVKTRVIDIEALDRFPKRWRAAP